MKPIDTVVIKGIDEVTHLDSDEPMITGDEGVALMTGDGGTTIISTETGF